MRREVTIPVIASGGAGAVEHFPPAVDAGADAVLAATVFHFGTLRIGDSNTNWNQVRGSKHNVLLGTTMRSPCRPDDVRLRDPACLRESGWHPRSPLRGHSGYYEDPVFDQVVAELARTVTGRA